MAFIAFIFPFTVMGQFERKVSVYAFVGASGFSGNLSRDSSGLPKNMFGKYNPAPTVGVAAFYALDGHLSVGGSLKLLLTEKTASRLFQSTLGADIKYNILPSDKRISPYILFEGNISFSSIKQNNYVEDLPVPSSANGSGNVSISDYQVRYTSYNLFFVPAVGTFFAGGVDVRLKESLHVFGQVGYNTTFIKGNSLLKGVYPTNNSNLSYANISVGVRLNLFQKKSFY